MTKEQHEETITLLKEVVEASNRTNHAVRAIVRPIYVQLITHLVLLPLIALYAFTGELGVLLFIGAIGITGTGISIFALVTELKSSNIPYDFSQELVEDYEWLARDVELAKDDEGECECTSSERGAGNLLESEGKTICGRCGKSVKS